MSQQLLPIDAVTPGRAGLNLQQKGTILTQEWVTNALNCVLDDARRLAARQGYSVTTTTPIGSTPDVEAIHEYLLGDGTVEPIVSWNGGIGKSLSDPEGNDVSGAVTDADGRWWFQNFNNKCIGFQHGQKPTVYSGSTFATISESSGTAPTSHNGIGLSAYGRVWALDSDGQTVKYSGLLDEADWGSASAGSIDMSNVWSAGMDEVTAIAAFNGSFLVFGKNHIVIWDDPVGSALGFDPVNMVVVDVVEGTGCHSHWTIQNIDESDLVYLSRNGLQSLGRVIQEKSNPVNNVSKYVRDDFLADVVLEDPLDLRTVYTPEEGLYIISIPVQKICYVFDVRNKFQDQEGSLVYPCTTWDLFPTALAVRQDGALLFGAPGNIWTYGADSDDGTLIRFEYASPWLDFGEDLGNRLKMLKRIGSIMFVRNNAGIEYKWATDFRENDQTISRIVIDPVTSEWNIGEWALGEWSGGMFLQIIKVPARATGQYFRIKIETNVTGQFAIQQLELFTKIGRIA
jgi:hypothetical protein